MKEATLKIGNSQLAGTIKEVTTAIKEIFRSGFVNRIEQNTIQEALRALSQISKIENVTVQNSTFKGDKTININDDESQE